ncbi:Hypothetical predicted protein [Olea europaea subsp. europaea]|uniref:Uncharacterized protein n=1 Tax=Olea europaea subsp. europaea TaxID=158383 RepID=A0A8S0VKE9_OLEEU|nr:Hypothetical predicted protein [Olea europaea subsp. europaea]
MAFLYISELSTDELSRNLLFTSKQIGRSETALRSVLSPRVEHIASHCKATETALQRQHFLLESTSPMTLLRTLNRHNTTFITDARRAVNVAHIRIDLHHRCNIGAQVARRAAQNRGRRSKSAAHIKVGATTVEREERLGRREAAPREGEK